MFLLRFSARVSAVARLQADKNYSKFFSLNNLKYFLLLIHYLFQLKFVPIIWFVDVILPQQTLRKNVKCVFKQH